MKHLALLHGLLLTLFAPLAAQELAANADEKPGRRAWLVAAQMPKDLPNPLPVFSDNALHQVPMHLRQVHESVPVDEAGVVRVVKPQVGDDGKVRHVPLAVAQLPEGVREALIVLVPDHNKDGLAFRGEVIDLAKFKKGGCLFVNLVKTKVGVTIGEHKTVVNSGDMNFINALGDERRKVVPVRFFYELPKEQNPEWRLMTAAQIALFQGRREITVFFFNPEIENVDFRGITFPALMPKMVQHDR